MRTYTTNDPQNAIFAVITEFALGDIEDLKKNESQFLAVMKAVVQQIADKITTELEPRIKDYIISKIDIEALVQDAAKQRVQELLFGERKLVGKDK